MGCFSLLLKQNTNTILSDRKRGVYIRQRQLSLGAPSAVEPGEAPGAGQRGGE